MALREADRHPNLVGLIPESIQLSPIYSHKVHALVIAKKK